MMAFNQGLYISEAIQSVVSQDLPETWELLIGDDDSSDNTEIIVEGWIKRFPQNIKYYKHTNNIGLHNNYEFLIKKSRGVFIALLEADDFWIDKEKCKRQVEFLEHNENVAWCFTNGCLVDKDGEIIKNVELDVPLIFNLNFFVENFFNPLNNSIMFRKSAEPRIYPDFFFKVRQWDTILHYLRALNGDIGFIPIQTLAWRQHESSTTHSAQFSSPQRYKDWIIINNELKKRVPNDLKNYFNKNYVAYEYLSIAYAEKRIHFFFLFYMIKMILNKPIRPFSFYRDYFWKIRNPKN